nr:hypothetical protein [Tanacetum cinerariifolium]
MSSPNHPTSDIKDAFYSNFHDYFPATSGTILLTLQETSPKDTKTSESPTPVSISSSVGSSSPVRSTTPLPDYPFDESIFAELDNSLWIISRPLRGEPDLEEPNDSDAYNHLWK